MEHPRGKRSTGLLGAAAAVPALVRDDGFQILSVAALAAIIAGLGLDGTGHGDGADVIWAATVAAMLMPLAWSVAKALLDRRVGVDVIALVAMGGALAIGEYLAGAIVALMLAGGGALEAAASSRARRSLTELLARAPKVAHRRQGENIEEVPIGDLRVGDVAVVRMGEVLPVDGVLESRHAALDEATLTGESLPVTYSQGELIRSGAVNAGAPLDVRATCPASESAYAALVRLVEQAEQQRAPFTRLADRYAALLLPATLLVAGGAWVATGDRVRALTVVVVATPCPLILAAPIAFVSGISRAAKRGIIVKGGGVIERLGRARSVLLDKTGTLTLGTPAIKQTILSDGIPEPEVVRLAASLDQLSAHGLAEALVAEARGRGLELDVPVGVREEPGQGIQGHLAGREVAVGSPTWLAQLGYASQHGKIEGPDVADAAGLAKIGVGVDGKLVATIIMADRLRPDAPQLISDLRAAGIRHIAMVSGDRLAVAEAIGRALGLDRVYAEQSPEDKLEVVRAVRKQRAFAPVLMVGDGVNDAPALAMADVGIAMGAKGATASSETADAVITVDRIDRVAEAVRIGQRSLHIATQSVAVGMGLSGAAMALAAAGLLTPVPGALLQEAIDVAVILNALRALRP